MNAATALRLACSGPLPSLSNEAVAALEQCANDPDLVRLAEVHGVAPWLAAAVAGKWRIRHAAMQGLNRAAARQTFHALRLFSELTAVVTHLNAVQIPVVVLKGPVLAQSLYHDASLRPYGDVDILIRESDLVSVSRFLLGRGYFEKNDELDHEAHRIHECHGVFQRIFINESTGLVVEVHCDHLQIGLEPVGMEEIWASSTPVSFGRAEARALEPHDLFVQLCVHLQRHGYERLIWFKDLDLMVRQNQLDWEVVAQRARDQGCLAAVSYTLWLLPKVLRTPMPEGAAKLAQTQGVLSRLLYRRMWPVARVMALEPQRQWRFRRLVQFAPETGWVRGGLPSFITNGRRRDKVRVLWATIRK